MPSRNVLKDYKELSYYHVYNRGINKQEVFLDDQDFETFLKLTKKRLPFFGSNKIDVYSVLPNHYHFLLFQTEIDSMPRFMSSLIISYTKYFNNKYEHIGPIFMPKYRARLVKSASSYRSTYQYIFNNAEKAGYENWKYMGTSL